MVLTFESEDEILKCDHLKESYSAVVSCGAVYYTVQAVFKTVSYENFQGAYKTKNQRVRSPTCEVLGDATKNLGAQSNFLNAPG